MFLARETPSLSELVDTGKGLNIANSNPEKEKGGQGRLFRNHKPVNYRL